MIKFGKMVKSLHFFQSYSEYFLSGIFFVLVKSYSISPVRLQRIIRKSFVPAFFFKSLLLTYLITLSLEKESIVLVKSLIRNVC